MEIDLSLKIDNNEQKEEAKVDDKRVKVNDKEEVPEATTGEIEDDSSLVVELSLQECTKTNEVI